MKDKKGRFKKGYASEYGAKGGVSSWKSRTKGMSKAEIKEMMSKKRKGKKKKK